MSRRFDRAHDSDPLPAFDVVGPAGVPRTVRPAGRSDTVGDLARALDIDPFEVAIEGRHVGPHQLLIDCDDLGQGARVDTRSISGAAARDTTEDEARPPVEVAVTVGPACTPWRPLPPGRHVVGRSHTATVRVADPQVEAFAGVLDVSADGAVDFRQLTGAVAARAAGVPCSAVHRLTAASPVDIGASRLEIRSSPSHVERREHLVLDPIDPWRRSVRRTATPHDPDPPVLDAPPPPEEHPRPPATPLIGGLVGVVGSLVLGIVMGNPLFAAFAMFGAVASLATWAAGRLTARRRTRDARRVFDENCRRFVERLDAVADAMRRRHHRRYRPISSALTTAEELEPDVWHTHVDGDAIHLTIGIGNVRRRAKIDGDLPPDLDAEVERRATLPDVPVPLLIAAGSCTAIRGPRIVVAASVRALIIQAATWYGPSDVGIAIEMSMGDWEWTRWLPHRVDMTAVTSSPGGSPLPILVTDDPDLFVCADSALRTQLRRGQLGVLLVLDADAEAPAVCQRVLDVGETARTSWVAFQEDCWTDEDADCSHVRVAAIDEPVAREAARSLAALTDPDDERRALATLPTDVSLETLLHGDHSWDATNGDAPSTPIGVGADGPVVLDLVRDGPHALVAGTTGSGKSEFLRTLVVGLAARSHPEQITFVLIDYKGGSTFDACVRLPHVVGLVTDLDDGAARRALIGLDAELSRRERVLRAAGAADLAEYRAGNHTEPVPRLVVVVDEFASLAKEVPEFLGALVATAQRGRSLGIHLVLATQRPAGVVSDDIRANTDLRIALRLNDNADALDVVGDQTPTQFARDVPGRIAIRRAGEPLIVCQSARATCPAAARQKSLTAAVAGPAVAADLPVSEQTYLDVLVDDIVERAARAGCAPPHRPWLDPLPTVLRPIEPDSEQPDGVVGVIDDPSAQCRHPLAWDPTRGSLALIGAVGAGLTSTLVAVVTAQCRIRPPGTFECFVIDACGDDRLDVLASIAHCAGVVRPHESERLERVLSRLVGVIDARRSQPGLESRNPIVCVVDGVSALRTAMSEPRFAHLAELFERVLREGPAVGVSGLLADHGTALAGASFPLADRWIFEICDPAVASLVGGGAASSEGRPGRLRIAPPSERRGLEAHVAIGAVGLADLPTRHESPVAVAEIGVLPDDLDRAPLPPSSALEGTSGTALSLGLCAERLAPASLHIGTGDHALVLGGACSGVTSTLDAIASEWRSVHGEQSVIEWPGSLGDIADLRGSNRARRLLVIDDAHRVGDQDGALARLIEDRTLPIMVCAGARLEAIRSSYGHWTRGLAGSRCGVMLTAGGPSNGDVFGAELPRRTIVAPRPGLAWLIDARGERLVQIARRRVADLPDSLPERRRSIQLDVSGGSSPRR